ncbi:MAG: hypothetical protein K2X82_00415 [Gemmataceae bacterium]|nr:hypothetical protein [Gemmataceae bacterium]
MLNVATAICVVLNLLVLPLSVVRLADRRPDAGRWTVCAAFGLYFAISFASGGFYFAVLPDLLTPDRAASPRRNIPNLFCLAGGCTFMASGAVTMLMWTAHLALRASERLIFRSGPSSDEEPDS